MKLESNKLQGEVIEYSQKEMLVRGVAGSGKTICLIKNAIIKAEKEPENRIYFFTYNKTLKKYIEIMFKKQGFDNIYVNNFHSWAFSEVRNLYPGFRVLSSKERSCLLQESIKAASQFHKGRFIKEENENFLLEEFSYISSQYIRSRKEYLTYNRIGRGNSVRLSKKDREEIYSIFEFFESLKYSRKKFEFSDFAKLLLNGIHNLKVKKMERVYIDEGQDLDKAQLLLLRKLAQESFYIAADMGQKIYKTSYTWKDVGVNVLGGRTKVLTQSFRTTKEILELAECFQMKDSIVDDNEFQKSDMTKMRRGYKPKVVYYEGVNSKDKLVSFLKESYTTGVNHVVGLLVREKKHVNTLACYLRSNGISIEEIRDDLGNTTTSGIKITTRHSSKGLEFDHVIIVDFQEEHHLSNNNVDEDTLNAERRLNYVSFSRARQLLTIFASKDKPSILFEELDPSLYEEV